MSREMQEWEKCPRDWTPEDLRDKLEKMSPEERQAHCESHDDEVLETLADRPELLTIVLEGMSDEEITNYIKKEGSYRGYGVLDYAIMYNNNSLDLINSLDVILESIPDKQHWEIITDGGADKKRLEELAEIRPDLCIKYMPDLYAKKQELPSNKQGHYSKAIMQYKEKLNETLSRNEEEVNQMNKKPNNF